MKQPSALLSLIAVMQTTALTAGSITVSSGNVQTAGNQVITGSGARAQATVDQRGSVVRLGSNTAAQVGDRGDVSLSKGVVLISSGDGFLRRPAVQVSTPQGDVTVRGSAIVAALPDGSVKMTCLEGSVRGDLGGQNMALNPGNLIVQRPEGTRDTVQVNLNSLTHSSTLLDNASFKQPLPAAPEIRQEVAQQAQALGATLTLARNDSNSTQKLNLNGATNEFKNGEIKVAEVKSAGPGLLARIFSIGGSDTKTDDNATVLGSPQQSQNGNAAPPSTVNLASLVSGSGSLRVSGAISGSNVFLNGTVAPGGTTSGATLTLTGAGVGQPVPVGATATPVLVNGSTQQLANVTIASNVVSSGSATLSNANVISGTNTLVKAGSGALTLSSGVQNVQGATLNNGTLVLQGQAAQQFTSGNLTVNGPGGTLTPTSNSGGVITFQAIGGGSTPPAAVAP